MRIVSFAILAALLLPGCAAVKRNPQLLSKPPAQTLSTLKQYKLNQPIPAGYDQYQYEDLQGYFSTADSSRSITLLPVDKNNRTPLPGGINCKSRTWYLLSFGLAPSICRYEKVYSLEIQDTELGKTQRHDFRFVETRTLSLFAPLLLPLPQWSFGGDSSDNGAVYSLINKAASQ